MTQRTLTPEPIVRLVKYFDKPYETTIATARTCYSSKVISDADVSKDERSAAIRDRIAQSIYKAGHHTTFQHATFQFVLDNVSRQFIWSFLHSHPYYNSEQVSQRYVGVKPERFVTPPLAPKAAHIYSECMLFQMDAYARLIELLRSTVEGQYKKIYPNRDVTEKRWAGAIKKRAQEVARYVLPLATHAHLYHTISGLTLHRYHRLMEQFDATLEQRIVITKMLDEVKKIDPLFTKTIEDPIPLEDTAEHKLFVSVENGSRKTVGKEFIKEFDGELGGLSSRLIDYKANAEKTMARAVRSVLGFSKDRLSDVEAIEHVMNPARNPYFSESLNVTSHAKLTRTMAHPHFTFMKKLSHTADSQDQRHRMTPGSRPIMAAQFLETCPDYIVPTLVQASQEAREYYHRCMQKIWQFIGRLLEEGTKHEFALYLLPNAFPVRFEESGDLMAFHHKWTTRLCYTAQEEIWQNCLDEVKQVSEISPAFGRFLRPPCGMRLASNAKPICPEGDRYCGVNVWKLGLDEYERLI